MKAIVQPKYGSTDVLQLKELETPTVKDDEVLVRIHAASMNYGNLALLKGKPLLARLWSGLVKPKYPIPGGDIAGRVEAVGAHITQFQLGDEVFGDLSSDGWGGFAEYVAAPEHSLVRKPVTVSFEEAAAVPMAAVTALQALRDKGDIQAGQDVLIYGASGGVGTFAVQLAKSFGATVTAVCSTRHVDLVQSLGADVVIDYKKEEFTRQTEQYDLILGVNGYQPLSVYKRALKKNGTYVMVGGGGKQIAEAMMLGPWMSLFSQKKLKHVLQKPNQKDLLVLKDLLQAGEIRSVIDCTFSFSEVPNAFAYFEQGHATGKVVITI
ncbi:NAD(P)-dependent alcohol dehydrogenase [Metabacillus iocasae]|uniref:NADPH:quinone reductase-like Zn-dependent oxidoreductase n=1 Tax=Priestia iocasae TaxID=2291674 RepID=A0ABS2QVV8_9BACI|nr:NADPH:quinone reductase-like Zn-dependent oxidoreductase [Metabacillus iocasae]